MDNRNAQKYMEDRIKSPGAQRAGVEPTISGVRQVVFQDAAGMAHGKEPSAASEGPEEDGGTSEEGFPELRTLKQRHPAYPGKKQPSWGPRKGPEELQAGQDLARSGSELGVLPSRVPAAHTGLQEQGSGKETKDQQGTQQSPGTVESQAPKKCQEGKSTGERRALDNAQKQPQEPTVATGAQHLGNTWQGFMKCLLEVEEEEATHRRATKALPNRKSPRTLTPVPTSAPAGNSPPSLTLTPASAPAMAPSWVRMPVPGPIPVPVGAPVPASVPVPVLPAPAPDLSWRRTEVLQQSGERNPSYAKARLLKLYQKWEEERAEEQLTLKQEEAFRSYFEIFNGQGQVDAGSLQNMLLLMGISLTPAQVEEALMSADVDGDGRVGFKDFLAVMTDTTRFLCSVEQNAETDVASPNPHTLLFEVLSLLVEMLALPEEALEEITNYYQRKLKEGTSKAREMESTIGQLRSQKKLPHSLQQANALEVPERRVLRILSRLKQQNYAANLQSPYAQVPCIPLCPRMDKKTVRQKQGGHYALDQCTPSSLGPDIRSLFLQSGSQGSREHS